MSLHDRLADRAIADGRKSAEFKSAAKKHANAT